MFQLNINKDTIDPMPAKIEPIEGGVISFIN